VRDENSVFDKLQPSWRHFSEDRGRLYHFVFNASERHDKARDWNFRIYERDKFIDDPATANSVSAEFNNAVGRQLSAGGFNVDYNEVEFAK
jgi:hypothetical protein